MDFFKTLAARGAGTDLLLRIKEKNGLLTISLTPEIGDQTKIIPLVLTGTPEEMDEGFFQELGTSLEPIKGLISNATDFKKEVEGSAAKPVKKENKPGTKTDGKTSPGKSTKENAGKKARSGKTLSKNKQDQIVPSTPDIFSQPGADPAVGEQKEQSNEEIDEALSQEVEAPKKETE